MEQRPNNITGRLEEWSVSYDAETDPYRPPETKRPFLCGAVYGHSKQQDGHRISTSYIEKVDGNLITTSSGSVYELSDPDPLYVDWCKKHNIGVPTKEQPIKIIKE